LAFLKRPGKAVNEKLLPQEWPASAVFTVGHSTLPIQRFVALLHTFGIEQLPISARCRVPVITRN
jgi:hypothetical protein